jgi:hypothetical protein
MVERVRAAAQLGPVSHVLLEEAYKLAVTREMEDEIEEASFLQLPPGQLAVFLRPFLWDFSEDETRSG